MPELKHTFSNGRMNKDLDERLVQEGDYRDATNIEVTTSEGSNSGVVQTLRGNIKINNILGTDVTQANSGGITDLSGGVCVGSIAAPDKDKIYYFVNSDINPTTGASLAKGANYIIEYDVIREYQTYVFVDIFRVNATVSADITTTNSFYITLGAGVTTNQTGIRVGMKMSSDTYPLSTNNITVTDIAYDTTESKWKVTVDTDITIDVSDDSVVWFTADSVLGFERNNIITGINIVDDFLFWTDNETEPKKINIPRSIAGTGGTEYLIGGGNGGLNGANNNATTIPFNGDTGYFHTRLVIDDPTSNVVNYIVVMHPDTNEAVYVEESNITVIKKSPNTTLDLDMYRTSVSRVNPTTGEENLTQTTATNINDPILFAGNVGDTTGPFPVGYTVTGVNFDQPVDYREGDVLLFENLDGASLDSASDENTRDVRVEVVSGPATYPGNLAVGPFDLEILAIKESVTTANDQWKVVLEDKDTLFNFKFPRFSYRWKYSDGEYSTFAPWSEIAFLPDYFDYQPKKGHNLGMKNMLRGLRIKGYHPHRDTIPQDVVAIDILYKEAGKPTVYTVKTITPKDPQPLWPDTDDGANNQRGEFELDTDMIHSIVPSNQLLRPWDNVPKKALAQEVSANRIIYGNYVQGYDVRFAPKLNLSISSGTVKGYPKPSVKTMRDYQVGIVFSDKYGRETPVLTTKDSSIRCLKLNSDKANCIKVQLDESMSSDIPSWAEYYSFYVKETSVEYYTMSMDRWYNASDGNIWLSFPSSERNKVMEEDFLVLKKAHGTEGIVHEKAKYRVIAIENEAPDFIKTRRVSLGSMLNYADGDQSLPIGAGGLGYPLPETRFVMIDKEAFQTAFGDQMHIDPPERLFIRITSGGEYSSQHYRVSKVASGENEDKVKITVTRSFGEDMSFTSTDGTFNGAIDGITLELTEERIENHPEFDGRFFVKIFKDDVLDQYVTEALPEAWFTNMAWPIGYINNNGYVNAGTRLAAGADSSLLGTPPGISGTIPNNAVYAMPSDQSWQHNTNGQNMEVANQWERHYTSSNYPHGICHPTEYDWSNLSGYDANDYSEGAQYLWFNNDTDSDYWGETTSNMSICSIRAINGATENEIQRYRALDGVPGSGILGGFDDQSGEAGNSYEGSDQLNNCVAHVNWGIPARKFWVKVNSKDRFFIDGATAYQLAGSKRDLPGNRFTTLNVTPNSGGYLSLTSTYEQGDGSFEDYTDNGGTLPIASGAGYMTEMVPRGNWLGHSLVGDNALLIGNTYIDGSPYPPFTAKGPTSFWPGGPSANYYANDLCLEAYSDDYGASNMNPGNYYSNTAPDGFDCSFPYTGSPSGITTNEFIPSGGGGDFQWWHSNTSGGTPSRGIWNPPGWDGSAIDLSWSSWNDPSGDSWGVAEDSGALPHTLANVQDLIGSSAWEFIRELVTPGTKFRFKRDPDKQVYTVYPYMQPYTDQGYDNSSIYKAGTTIYDGAWGIRNCTIGGSSHYWMNHDAGAEEWNQGEVNPGPNRALYAQYNRRQRWTILVKPKIGDTEHGYNPIHGTDPDTIDSVTDTNWRRALQHDGMGAGDVIEIVTPFATQETFYTENPAIWETEPRESVELDIYYQASRLIPLKLNKKTIEEYIPVGSTFKTYGYHNPILGPGSTGVIQGEKTHTVAYHTDGNTIRFNQTFTYLNGEIGGITGTLSGTPQMISGQAQYGGTEELVSMTQGTPVEFTLPDGSTSTLVLAADAVGGYDTLSFEGDITTENAEYKLFSQTHKLGWKNCWSFANGVESDRIRDDFNAPQVDNGVKASATLGNRRVTEEHKKYGVIWSGVYNSNSGVNDTNQFIAAEAITKDINPTHGSIQALKARDTRLIMFCEDKVLRAETNRDVLFNADGNSQVVASNKVVGAANAYQGDYGISTNPESLVATPYSMYFADINRGKVLALSGEGVRPISDLGMKDYFADTTNSYIDKVIGTWDERKNEYNISIGKKYNSNQKLYHDQVTASYSENSKGWTSFKTFYKTYQTEPSEIQGLEGGLSLNNKYYTFLDGHIWQHHIESQPRNNFYGVQYTSDITAIFNDTPEAVKSFNTINYEGSQAKITNWDDSTVGVDGVGFYNNDLTTGTGASIGTTSIDNVTDGEYHNLGDTIPGWYTSSIVTNLQSCGILEFKDKEGKWFAYPTGDSTTLSNLDEKEFSVQGLGIATLTHDDPTLTAPITISLENNTSTTYNPDTEIDGNTDGGADGVWDVTAD